MGSLATAAGRLYPSVSPENANEAAHRRELAYVLQLVTQGKMNNTGTLTLTANAASTTLSDPRIGAKSCVLLMPTTANAAGALATTYFDTFADGSCKVNHANNAQVDRILTYAIFG